MSGSGGGGSYGGQFGNDFEVACEKIVFLAQLSSPVAHVVSQLKPGDVLQISQQVQGTLRVTVASYNGQTAGGIASPKTQRISECIGLGTRYVADILSITNGQVQVRVHAV
ncbi:hypothetical protein AB5J03_003113 [Yersinia enterocolitica]|nr:hypothetical protein [Yersinia enterocolitica]EKN3994435.1 hypothetical protein [Yersinia enterocolitica]EKN5083408.1 hypothetical protein [Yersinia enterocolitica]EKN6400318.1 hypothetical protein [Yersinia enterocolitica]EKP3833007.1 hypothetical protein [Yersinia enterocolitica]